MYNVFLKDKRTGRDVFYQDVHFYLNKAERGPPAKEQS